MRNFVTFCEQWDLVPFPLIENNLVLFATELSKSVSVSAINVQLAGIKFMDHRQGHNTKFSEFQRLYMLIRGIKRTQGRSFKKEKRVPITPGLLRSMKDTLFNSSRNFHDKLMIWSAMLCAFFGFLRISEYTATGAKRYEQQTTLCTTDVTFHPQCCTLVLKASKTDPFREGVTLRFEENNTDLCPVTALRQYLVHQARSAGPLFVFSNGSFLTRQSFAKVIQALLPRYVNGVSTHSFRIGAATTAAAAGFPRWLIKSLGRWSSDCFRQYIRIPRSTIQNVCRALTQDVGNNVSAFDPDLV